jgi:hypothetical protein
VRPLESEKRLQGWDELRALAFDANTLAPHPSPRQCFLSTAAPDESFSRKADVSGAGAPRAKESSQSRGTAAAAAVYAIRRVFVDAAM